MKKGTLTLKSMQEAYLKTRKSPKKWKFEKGFSWNKPIEQNILKFVRSMAEQMEEASEYHRESGWFANNRLSEDAQKMADAYRTVEKHIYHEIKLREFTHKNVMP